MRILAIDTATEACSVALWNDGNIFTYFEECPREHAQRILIIVKKILDQNNVTLNELDAIAFGRGPGSFTGVRVGIGIMQGLALGAALPMIGISTLATIAQGTWRKTGNSQILVAINACRGEVYWAKYIRNEQGIWCGEETEAILKLDVVNHQLKQLTGEWAVAGTGWQILPKIINNSAINLINSGILLPEAEDMLPIAHYLLTIGRSVAVEHAEPVYLRNEDTWKKIQGCK